MTSQRNSLIFALILIISINMELLQQNPWIVLLLILWVIPWKGYALWLAAKKDHKWWFIVLLVLNTLAILDIVYIFFIGKKENPKIDTEIK